MINTEIPHVKNFTTYEKIFENPNKPHDLAKSELAAEMKNADLSLTEF